MSNAIITTILHINTHPEPRQKTVDMTTFNPPPPRNGFVRVMRKAYNPIGFSKGYNAALWFIFGGALVGFTLARLSYLNFAGVFCGNEGSDHAAPGECFNYQSGHEKVGIIMHLATILPAAFLVVFQFVPFIRHHAIMFHRVNGYLIVLLALLSTAGVLMIARNAYGGEISTQLAVGFGSIVFVGALLMAYINIKRLQIEQHRAWMLRAWFYAGSIITARFILILGAMVISDLGGHYYQARPCAQLHYIYDNSQNATLQAHPDCAAYFSGQNVNKWVAVEANLHDDAAAAAAALGANFGSAVWFALVIHAIGVEIYLRLTPAESERLRNVSYQRQIEAGMKNPGRAGLTADRFGDSEKWRPESELGNDDSLTDIPAVLRK